VTDGRAWVEIDLNAIRANAKQVCADAHGAKLLAVVKSNAYGLGAARIAQVLDDLHPWGFAVATIDEGMALREAGIHRPILVLRPAQAGMLEYYRHYRLRPVVESLATLESCQLPFHVEIDTGMGRTGIRWDEERTLEKIGALKPEGVFTHFHSADNSPESVALQWQRFLAALSAMKYNPRLLHAANSAGVWRLNENMSLVRPGIYLFGGLPCSGIPEPEPVVSLKAEIISVRPIHKGESVSYGADWQADTDTRVATLGIGYADGVPRALEGEGFVLIKGRRYRLIGRVTMDMIMIDIGPKELDAPNLGEVVTLIGSDGNESISLDQFAAWSKTVSYEVLTRLGNRLPRIYID
jgi:alanine racemase